MSVLSQALHPSAIGPLGLSVARHPVTVALYGVVFDEFPEARAAAEAEQFLSRTTLRGLHDMVDEIDLELNAPPVSGERLPG